MLRALNEIRGYVIRSRDGDIGGVHDFYFDDQKWTVRYLVADTGKWLPGRKVLISPAAIGQPQWREHVISVNLTKDQVKHSPSIDAEKPVSRQMEEELFTYYGWPNYWVEPLYGVPAYGAAAAGTAMSRPPEPSGDPHLHSGREVTGYYLHATDGDIGHVEDFVFDDESLKIRYLVVDTKNWLPGKKVLISTDWIAQISWPETRVFVDVDRQVVKDSPEFDPSRPVNRVYEEALYDYYGRPVYW